MLFTQLINLRNQLQERNKQLMVQFSDIEHELGDLEAKYLVSQSNYEFLYEEAFNACKCCHIANISVPILQSVLIKIEFHII